MLSNGDLERLIAEKKHQIEEEKIVLGLTVASGFCHKRKESKKYAAARDAAVGTDDEEEEQDGKDEETVSERHVTFSEPPKKAEEIPPDLERYIRRYLGLPVMLKAGEYSPNNPLIRSEYQPSDVLFGIGEYERRRNTLRKLRQQQYREYLDQQAKKKQEAKEQAERERREREEKERQKESEIPQTRELEQYNLHERFGRREHDSIHQLNRREQDSIFERRELKKETEDRRASVCYGTADETTSYRNKVDSGVQVGIGRPLSVAVQTDDAELYGISNTHSKYQLTQAERELSPRTVEHEARPTYYDSRPLHLDSRHANHDSRHANHDSRHPNHDSRSTNLDSKPLQNYSKLKHDYRTKSPDLETKVPDWRASNPDCRASSFSRTQNYESRHSNYQHTNQDSRHANHDSRHNNHDSGPTNHDSRPSNHDLRHTNHDSRPLYLDSRHANHDSRSTHLDSKPQQDYSKLKHDYRTKSPDRDKTNLESKVPEADWRASNPDLRASSNSRTQNYEERTTNYDSRPIKPAPWLRESKQGDRDDIVASRRRSYGDFDDRSPPLQKNSRDKLLSDLRHTYMPSIFDAEAIHMRNLQAEKDAAERRQFYQQELKNQIIEQQRIREERKTREKMLEQAEMRRLEEQLRMLRNAQDNELGRQRDINALMKESASDYDSRRIKLQKEIDTEKQKLRPIHKRNTNNTAYSDTHVMKLPLYLDKRRKLPFSTNIPDNSIFSSNYDVDSYLRKNLNPKLDNLKNTFEKYSNENVSSIDNNYDKDFGDLDGKVSFENIDLGNRDDGCENVVIEKAQIHERPKEKNKSKLEKITAKYDVDDNPIPVLRHSPKVDIPVNNEEVRVSPGIKLIEDKWKVPVVQKNILKSLPNEEGKNVSILTQLGSIRRQLQLEQLKLDNMASKGKV